MRRQILASFLLKRPGLKPPGNSHVPIFLGLATGAAIGIFAIHWWEDQIFFASRVVTRSARTLKTALTIGVDYRIFFKNSDDYSNLEKNKKVHERCAKRLLDLFQKNGGVYVKLGQHLAALEHILPPQYCHTLSVLHSQRTSPSSIADVYHVVVTELFPDPSTSLESVDYMVNSMPTPSNRSENGFGGLDQTQSCDHKIDPKFSSTFDFSLRDQKISHSLMKNFGPNFDNLGLEEFCENPEPESMLKKVFWNSLKSFRKVFQGNGKKLKDAEIVSRIFDEFDVTPIGCASLAQVHRARLRDGEKIVAVKVQHRKLAEFVAVDIFTMRILSQTMERLFPRAPSLRWVAREMERSIPEELDFRCEASNSERTRMIFFGRSGLIVPTIHWSLTRQRVLTMDYYEGSTLSNVAFLKENKINPQKICDLISNIFCEMIFKHGFVHCDPHPGNLLVTRSGDLVLLDHGLYRTLPDRMRIGYARIWLAMMRGDEANLETAFNSIYSYYNTRSNSPPLSGLADSNGISGQEKETKVYASDAEYSQGKNFTQKVMYHRLIGCILSQRAWQTVRQGKIAARTSAEESRMIMERAPEYLSQAAELLSSLPAEILMLLKTNDLLRHLERKLLQSDALDTVSPVSRSLIITAHHCVEASCEDEVLRGAVIIPRLRAIWLHLCIDCYELLSLLRWYFENSGFFLG